MIDIHETDEQRHIADFRVERVERRQIERNEARFENQILRRITGDREFRREHEFGAAADQVRDKIAMIFRWFPADHRPWC